MKEKERVHTQIRAISVQSHDRLKLRFRERSTIGQPLESTSLQQFRGLAEAAEGGPIVRRLVQMIAASRKTGGSVLA